MKFSSFENMQQLNLPEYQFRFKKINGKPQIFDRIRKKFFPLTPEEWVRQNLVRFLVEEKHYPESLLAIEMSFTIHGQPLRSDIVSFNNQGKPILVVECKAPSVKITQQTFDQIARYNMHLQVKHLIVSNGLQHYCCELHPENGTFEFLREIPDYKEVCTKQNNQ